MERTISAGRLEELLRGRTPGPGPAYQDLAGALRRLIVDGRVVSGVRLPSERELTRRLGVSRTTVTRAYDVLRESGYLHSRQGSGSVAVLPGGAANRGTSALSPGVGDPDTIDLTCAALSAPPGFLAAAERALQLLPGHLATRGYHPAGLPELRTLVADRFTARGLPTDADQVMITSGALAGVAAAMAALLGPGDRILMESPTYPNAVITARRHGARPVALPLDPSGWDPDAVAATLRQTAPRAAYLIPDFHNPTGLLMTEEQRAAVGRALQATHTVPIVDETLVELSLATDPHPALMPRPLAAFHPRMVTVGGVAKSLWGGLRVGWVRAPRELAGPVADARLTFDLSAPLLEQLVATELLRHQDELLADRRLRVVLARDTLAAALRERLPDWRFVLPAGGLSLWIELPEPRSAELCSAAERHGVILPAGSQFAVEGGMERYVRLPYTDLTAEVLADVVDRLALAWAETRAAPTTARTRTRLVA